MARRPIPPTRPRTPPPAPPATPRRDPAALERFVTGSSPRTELQSKAEVNRTTTYTRTDGADLARVTVYVPTEMHRALKARCAMRGRSVSDVITELVSGWLVG